MGYFLLPIVLQQSTYVKDTSHILKILEATPLPREPLLATLDVVSMYTNTPQEEALNASQEAFEKAPKNLYGIKPISPTSLRALMQLVLERNCFEFNGQVFLQKKLDALSAVNPHLKSAILSCIDLKIKSYRQIPT